MTERLSIPKGIFPCIFSDFTLLILTNFSKKKPRQMQRKKNKQNISKILRSILFSYFCLSPHGSLQVQYVVVTRDFIYNFKLKSLIIYLLLFLIFFAQVQLSRREHQLPVPP